MDKATANLIHERANHCCEYCKMPQECDDLPFQCDHIIAQVHDGTDDLARQSRSLYADSLFYNCNGPPLNPVEKNR